MKANAPEKIYLYSYSTDGIYEVETKPLERTVEYIRTDAFIEKAAGFLCECIEDYMARYMETWSPEMKAKTIENFKNYMRQ